MRGPKVLTSTLCPVLLCSLANTAHAEPANTRFAVQAMQIASAILERSGETPAAITSVSLMDYQSGIHQARDYAGLIEASWDYRISQMSFREKDIDLVLIASTPNARRCFDAVAVRFFPAGGKVALQYSVVPDRHCPSTVQIVKSPVESGDN